MKKLQILRVDNDLVQQMDLQIGNNIIGRGIATGCDDDRTIKHAVTINLSPDNEMTITPYQISPCYMKSNESSRWQLLKLGTTVPIKPGDICSLVPDKCWFKVILVLDKMENNQEHTLKRKVNDAVDYNISGKKLCSESGEGDSLQSPSDVLNKMLNNNNDSTKVKDERNVINEDNLSNDKDIVNMKVQKFEEACDASFKDEDKIHDSNRKLTYKQHDTDQLATVEKDVCEFQDLKKIDTNVLLNEGTPRSSKKNLNMSSVNQNNESVTTEDVRSSAPDESSVSTNTITNIPRRERCRYGNECFRANPRHKIKFSHPEDPDYCIPDDREECPYGSRCYRKNLQHKMQFKHADTNSRSERKCRIRRPVKVLSDTLSEIEDLSTEESVEESVDESEYEPSSNAESSEDDEMYFDKDESENDTTE